MIAFSIGWYEILSVGGRLDMRHRNHWLPLLCLRVLTIIALFNDTTYAQTKGKRRKSRKEQIPTEGQAQPLGKPQAVIAGLSLETIQWGTNEQGGPGLHLGIARNSVTLRPLVAHILLGLQHTSFTGSNENISATLAVTELYLEAGMGFALSQTSEISGFVDITRGYGSIEVKGDNPDTLDVDRFKRNRFGARYRHYLDSALSFNIDFGLMRGEMYYEGPTFVLDSISISLPKTESISGSFLRSGISYGF
jgi:hypothetical protein